MSPRPARPTRGDQQPSRTSGLNRRRGSEDRAGQILDKSCPVGKCGHTAVSRRSSDVMPSRPAGVILRHLPPEGLRARMYHEPDPERLLACLRDHYGSRAGSRPGRTAAARVFSAASVGAATGGPSAPGNGGRAGSGVRRGRGRGVRAGVPRRSAHCLVTGAASDSAFRRDKASDGTTEAGHIGPSALAAAHRECLHCGGRSSSSPYLLTRDRDL